MRFVIVRSCDVRFGESYSKKSLVRTLDVLLETSGHEIAFSTEREFWIRTAQEFMLRASWTDDGEAYFVLRCPEGSTAEPVLSVREWLDPPNEDAKPVDWDRDGEWYRKSIYDVAPHVCRVSVRWDRNEWAVRVEQ